jgi:hypothetical protein
MAMRENRTVQFLLRHWLTVAFLAGFLTDFLLLNRIDDWFDNIVLLFHVVVSTVSLLGLYAALAERFGERWSRWILKAASIGMQYSFGGLFSGMLIFYGRSGDVAASWPFLLCIALAIAGNELIHDRGRRLVFNVLAYFVGLFSYLVLVVPVFTGYMGPFVFFLSGLGALVIVYGIVLVLKKIIPQYMYLHTRQLVFVITGTFVMLNGLYFMNVIPPIPLSLKEITIAHSVIRYPQTREYELKYEPIAWWNLYEVWRPTIRPSATTAACYSSVFAPTKIKTEIFHQWDYYDEVLGEWVERFRIPYPITGEAVDGYRGFSASDNVYPGKWRCSVKSTRGQLLGHKVFYVERSDEPVYTETTIR